jgi:hypothetical protein
MWCSKSYTHTEPLHRLLRHGAMIPSVMPIKVTAMKKKLAFAFLPLVLWALASYTLTAQEAQNKPATVILTHVAVIDAAGAPAQTDMTVVIAGGRISEISKISDLHAPPGTILIDATGKFLIPGLWDMHVHWSDKEFLSLFLANGVTGMRIMWGQPQHHEWKRQSETGQLLAPHMVIASKPIDGPHPYWPDSTGVANPAQARQAVTDAEAAHADFIKVYSFLPRDEYFAIADEAKKQGLPFAGHVPYPSQRKKPPTPDKNRSNTFSVCFRRARRAARSLRKRPAPTWLTPSPAKNTRYGDRTRRRCGRCNWIRIARKKPLFFSRL